MGIRLIVGVIAAAPVVRAQLYGMPDFDAVAIGVEVLVLLLCAGIDPISALR